MFSKIFFHQNLYPLWDKMWQNIVQPDRPQMTIWRMRISCWIPKAINPHSEYIIFIALPAAHTRVNVTLHIYCLSFFRLLRFSLVSIIRPFFHTHTCLNVTLIGRKSGRSLETFNQGKDLSDMWQH